MTDLDNFYSNELVAANSLLKYEREKNAKVKKQLAIAVKALDKYANKDNWQNHYTINLNDWELELKVFDDGEVDDGEFSAQEALRQINELEE